jgi:hypothetical protein
VLEEGRCRFGLSIYLLWLYMYLYLLLFIYWVIILLPRTDVVALGLMQPGGVHVHMHVAGSQALSCWY